MRPPVYLGFLLLLALTLALLACGRDLSTDDASTPAAVPLATQLTATPPLS